MVGLFGQIPSHAEYFSIRPLRMKGQKVELPTMSIRSGIHCFVFITEGEALISIGEENYNFKAGECAAIPAGVAFAVRYFDNCSGYMGGFNDLYLNGEGKSPVQAFSALRRWGYHKVRFEQEQAGRIGDIFEKLLEEHITRQNKNIVRAYLTILLSEIEETLQDGENGPQTESNLCNRFIEEAFQTSNLSVPLAEYAEKLNITQNYLHKTVKRFTGKTPHTWITEAVILEAKVLLCQSEQTVGEIAFTLGINDPAYFSRFFKKQTGFTPQEYRKKSKDSPR